jgi:hypothetical protein
MLRIPPEQGDVLGVPEPGAMSSGGPGGGSTGGGGGMMSLFRKDAGGRGSSVVSCTALRRAVLFCTVLNLPGLLCGCIPRPCHASCWV